MVKTVVTKEEIKRLQRAAKDKNIGHLGDWATQFEKQISQEYEQEFKRQISESLEHIYIAIVYTLRFSELTNFGAKRIDAFMKDLLSTVENFKTGAYEPRRIQRNIGKKWNTYV